jgi:predicted secreted protein
MATFKINNLNIVLLPAPSFYLLEYSRQGITLSKEINQIVIARKHIKRASIVNHKTLDA